MYLALSQSPLSNDMISAASASDISRLARDASMIHLASLDQRLEAEGSMATRLNSNTLAISSFMALMNDCIDLLDSRTCARRNIVVLTSPIFSSIGFVIKQDWCAKHNTSSTARMSSPNRLALDRRCSCATKHWLVPSASDVNNFTMTLTLSIRL